MDLADERRTVLDGEIHHLADLARVGLGERTAEHREVLGEDVHQAAVDGAVAADHAIARHPLLLHAEVPAAMRHQRIDLDEGRRVEQQLDALARGQLAGGVLARDTLGAAAARRGGQPALELAAAVVHLRFAHPSRLLSQAAFRPAGRHRLCNNRRRCPGRNWTRPPSPARWRSSPTSRTTSSTPISSDARRWSCRRRTTRPACGSGARKGSPCVCCAARATGWRAATALPSGPSPRPFARWRAPCRRWAIRSPGCAPRLPAPPGPPGLPEPLGASAPPMLRGPSGTRGLPMRARPPASPTPHLSCATSRRPWPAPSGRTMSASRYA